MLLMTASALSVVSYSVSAASAARTAIAGDPDTDGDGVPDSLDGCPTDPNKIAPGPCGCGVPDTDTDADGVADCAEIPIGTVRA